LHTGTKLRYGDDDIRVILLPKRGQLGSQCDAPHAVFIVDRHANVRDVVEEADELGAADGGLRQGGRVEQVRPPVRLNGRVNFDLGNLQHLSAVGCVRKARGGPSQAERVGFIGDDVVWGWIRRDADHGVDLGGV